jgi:hypothetical protein
MQQFLAHRKGDAVFPEMTARSRELLADTD